MWGMKSYIAGTGSLLATVARPPSSSTASAMARANAEGIRLGLSWPTVEHRRRAPSSPSTTALRAPPRGRPGAGTRSAGAPVTAAPRPRRTARGPRACGSPSAASSASTVPAASAWAARGRLAAAQASAAPPRAAAGAVSWPCSSSSRICMHARAPLGRVVLAQVQLGDALEAQVAQLVAHEGHRPTERLERRPPVALVTDDRDPHGGVAAGPVRRPRR